MEKWGGIGEADKDASASGKDGLVPVGAHDGREVRVPEG
jgi:hypothetical protein